ncbi:MAG TPA: hypothetical protein VGR32_02565 [Brevundimonas sp.]|uniref:hypothetical protein n=1 Tax=Brevundimonas sp. TaxID=1871086 RepID=UPI002DE7596F|nr:hypothetical protein [Brevundimonas sp.]
MTEDIEPTETPTSAEPPLARTDPKRKREYRPYKIRGPETWALIRESYLSGASAKQLARRYDVTEWAIWRRAWKEGWTKLDRVEARAPDALSPSPLPGAQSGGDPAALARRALLGVEHAMAAGRLDEAADLARLAASLSRLGAAPGAGSAGAGGAPGGDWVSLADVKRALLGGSFASELMSIDPDDPTPNPVKWDYWTELKAINDRLDGVNFACKMFVQATGGQGVAYTQSGMRAAREEAARYKLWRETVDGQAPVPPLPDLP